ncbi:MAG: type II toxin-antitoxin system RelE/ParE family toxin [Bacteroidia bacterium]|nr:type II toxin-antitoxin system RelE/ParE family toxin [Bacteroidia bacterium]
MEKPHKREIIYYKNYYFDFFERQRPEVQKKFNWTIHLIATLDRVPVKFFKHITGTKGLYEMRVEVGTDVFRVFCFFDAGMLVVLLNGFHKKTQKTPGKEIQLALKLMDKYYYEKEIK